MKNRNILFSLFLLMITANAISQNAFSVEKSGTGQPVLLLPGFACTSEVFEDSITELSKEYEVHSFTFAGFGGIPPISFPWLPQIKSGIEEYVRDNDLEKPIVIGHSLGGTLGLWLAADSNLFSKLILIDALPAMGALMVPEYHSQAFVYDSPQNKQILEMNRTAFQEMAKQYASYMTANAEKQNVLAKWMTLADRQTYVYGYTDLLKLDLRDRLAKIQVPVHILAATLPYGKETAEKNYKEQYENLGSYTLKFAEDSGHFIMFDQPEWLMGEIKTILATDE